ncbi:MAG: ECF transporter S component [Oscillospiraceae bacterium]|jgi:riboflavin transporter FmnP|nr:ECF transporter S component [Oscillospiraceae bacterium]
MQKSNLNTRKLTVMAMMLAISVAFSFIPTFPLLPGVAYIKYEFSDLPILISTFAFGTPVGVVIAALTVALNFVIGGAESGIYGAIMHVLAMGSYAAVAGIIYHFKKTRIGALIGMIGGIIAMTAIMIPANLFITTYFNGMPRSVVAGLLVPAIIPANLAKGALTAVLTFILYRYISPFLHGRTGRK